MISRHKIFILSMAIACLSQPLWAQTSTPKEQIPTSIMLQIDGLDSKFKDLLTKECLPEMCHYRGCVYQKHEVVTMRSDQGLPGLNMGSNQDAIEKAPQFFLSRARCEYAYEPGLQKESINLLDSRLRSLLSKGMLRVGIKSIPLKAAIIKEKSEEKDESIKSLLKDFITDNLATLIFIGIGSILTLILIWALRRLGKDSLADQLLFLKHKKEIEEQSEKIDQKKEEEDEAAQTRARVTEYYKKAPQKIQSICRKWLMEGHFEKLGHVSALFAKTGIALLPEEKGLLQKKIKLERYLNESFVFDAKIEEETISDLEKSIGPLSGFHDETSDRFNHFFTQSHPRGIAKLIESVDTSVGATILSFASQEVQKKCISYLDQDTLVDLSKKLITSPFISNEAIALANSAIDAAIHGREVTPVKPNNLFEHGTLMEVDALLSSLLEKLPENRKRLWEGAKAYNAGQLPAWTHGIFYTDMLKKLDDHQLKAVFLECDAKVVAPWFNQDSLDPSLRERILNVMPESYKQAMISPINIERPLEEGPSALGKAIVTQSRKGELDFENVL